MGSTCSLQGLGGSAHTLRRLLAFQLYRPMFASARQALRSAATRTHARRQAATTSSSSSLPVRRPPTPRAPSQASPQASAKTESNFTPFLLVLTAVPITCAYLTYWQIERLKWKVELIEELELNLGRRAVLLPDEIECVRPLASFFPTVAGRSAIWSCRMVQSEGKDGWRCSQWPVLPNMLYLSKRFFKG